ncbi:MAG: GNAT family N-acetyltransferase [Armatimonadia bacterium]|nr:GNAT family N-acetyltransferase [Armatimonadia bacterium]
MGTGARRDIPAAGELGPSPYEPHLLRARDGEAAVLRPMTRDDADALAAFYRGLDEYTDRMFFVLSDFTPDITRDMAMLQERGAELHLVLVPQSTEVVGHLSLQPFPGVCPRLGICVKQGWQGRGLGRQVMELALAVVQAIPDSTGLWLSVLEENRGARELYESLGFQAVRERMVRRKFSRYRQNRGTFKLIDMILSFPLVR